MEFRVLGPVTVVDGGDETTIRQRRQRALLALLLLHLGETVAADRILEDLWGSDAPRTATASLHNAVSRLRLLVGASRLVTRAPGYALVVEPASLDTYRFEHLLGEAQAARSIQDHDTASVVLREALALWRGPAFADLAYEPFAQAEIRRLEELRQSALEERIEADLARGRHEEVVPELEQLVAAEPLRERLHGQLMLALYRSERQADALAAYRAARQTLVGELGIEPGPELRALEQSILRQDEALLLPGSAPLTSAPPMQFRRLATILFADALPTTSDDGELDPEASDALMSRFTEAAREVIGQHGGWLDKGAGDAFMAAFGAQSADETHALRAARAALDLQRAATSLNDGGGEPAARLELRIGLATGEVLVSGGQSRTHAVAGEAVRVAFGLQQAAAAGDIVVGPLVRRLLVNAAVEPVGELPLRGRTQPIAAFRLLSLPTGVAAPETREAPLVGRKKELKTLRAGLRRARATGAVEAVCVVGPAGIGKSRLAREVARGAHGFDVLVAGCLSYGEGITYWPVRQLVGSDRAAIEAALEGDRDAATSADRLTRFEGAAHEIAGSFRRWCEARARRRPLLLVVDDLHWAEPTFLELLEHLADRASGPIVLLGLAREELLEDRPGFLAAGRLALDGLPTADTEALADHLLGGATLQSDALARVLAAAEGNPLFLEQLVAEATEGDALDADRPLPATVQALLAARLDRLGPGERAVLERAAVVGRDFTPEEVATLLGPEAVPTLARHLDSLVRRGFIRPMRNDRLGFRHVLVQEAAYRAAPKKLRAALHENFADVLDRSGNAPDVLVGYHLERAYQLRVELGPPDRAAHRIAEDAGRRLAGAGLRAWRRHDAPAAANLIGRALALLPPSHENRRELLCELGLALKWMRDDARAEAVLRDVVALAAEANDERVSVRAELELAMPRLLRGEVHTIEVLELAERALDVFQRHSDDRGLGRAWMVTSWVHGSFGMRWGESAIAVEHALAHDVASGVSPTPAFAALANAAAQGPEPAAAGVRRCEQLIARSPEDAITRRYVEVHLAALCAMRSDFERARRLLREARDFDGRQRRSPSYDWVMRRAFVDVLAGDITSAEAVLREACRGLEAPRDATWLATFSAMLAEVVCVQDRFDEARELAQTAASLAHRDDILVEVTWKRASARAAAHAGDFASALAFVREANELLDGTDALNERAAGRLAAAEVLVLASRPDAALVAAGDGLALLRRKGNVAGLRRARTHLEGLGVAGRRG